MVRPYIHSRGIPDPITGCIHSCSILPPITRTISRAKMVGIPAKSVTRPRPATTACPDGKTVASPRQHAPAVAQVARPRLCTAAIGRIGPGSLGAVVRSFKSAVASRINALRGARVGGIWQRNYFDQVVRNLHDLNRVRRYIRDNPAGWERNRTC